MRFSPIAAALILAAAPLAAPIAATDTVVQSELGAVSIGQSAQVAGTISAIDATTREVTLTTIEGREMVIACGPEVKNFDQLQVGDVVEMEFIQALALELKKGSTAEIARTVEGAVASAKPGSTPGGVAGTRVHVVAEVLAMNPEMQTVTLQAPERTVDLRINDPAQFANISVGDRIEATYVEGMAVQVTPAEGAD
jgi:Cu/Ag efflux protein CusF